MDPLKRKIDEFTSYQDLDEQFYEARLEKEEITRSDWPSQIDRAAIDVVYGIAIGTTDSNFDIGGTIGPTDFGTACGEYYVRGLKGLADHHSDLPDLIDDYDPEDLGDLAFRMNQLRIELNRLGDSGGEIRNLNRATEALVEKLITRVASEDLNRQPLQDPEAVVDMLYQLFSDPAVQDYADILIDAITRGGSTSIGGESLLTHLDKPQMVTPLWDHQNDALQNWCAADTKGYVDMATATGKTVLGLAAIAHRFGDLHPHDAAEMPDVETSDGKANVLIVAGQDLLLEQWRSEFDEHLNIPRDRTRSQASGDLDIIELTWGDIEFRTAQSLLNEESRLRYDLVILDEAHRYSSGTQSSRGWRDLFEELVERSESILAMSGSIDSEWLGDSTAYDALESNLECCKEFTIEEAREENVIASFRWDVCYASSLPGETLSSVADSTVPLASVYDSEAHKFRPHELSGDVPESVPETFETLRDLRGFAHSKDGNHARDESEAFDEFATAAFSRQPKRWQLSPTAETVGKLLTEHVPERKAVVLVQSYAQAEVIGEKLAAKFGDEMVTVPKRDEVAPYDSIEDFKDSPEGILIGPGEVFGVGIDLPNVDVAVNISKGGVNASLIQRIGRVLRNPTGHNRAHFYQIVTVPADSDARIPGEDGRRLLRRASEFRALGTRFREKPGFAIVDAETAAAVRELEVAGARAKIEDHRPTTEIVEDEVAQQYLDELTSKIDESPKSSRETPVLTTYWQPESLAPGTRPVKQSVSQSNGTEQTETDDKETGVADPYSILVSVVDESGDPINDVSVTVTEDEFEAAVRTGNDGMCEVSVPRSFHSVDVKTTHPKYEDKITRTLFLNQRKELTIQLEPATDPVEITETTGERMESGSESLSRTVILYITGRDRTPLPAATVESPLDGVLGDETSEQGACEITVAEDAAGTEIPLTIKHPDEPTVSFELELDQNKREYDVDLSELVDSEREDPGRGDAEEGPDRERETDGDDELSTPDLDDSEPSGILSRIMQDFKDRF